MWRSSQRLAGGLLLAVSAACATDPFECQADAQCQRGEERGVCEPTGACSFADAECSSGRRYGEHAPQQLAGECVPLEGGTADGTDGPGPGSHASATTESDSAADDASSDAATSSSTSSSSGSTSMGDASGPTSDESSGGPASSGFFDAFDRPDASELGNGWIEKTPGAFHILSQRVVLDSVNDQDFRNNLFYRPLAESMLDVEATMVVEFLSGEPFGYPQLHLRVQADDVATAGSLTSYAVFVDSGGNQVRLTVNRIDGPGFGPSTSVAIVPPLVGTEKVRLHGRVTGVDMVELEGRLEVWDGAAWQLRTTASLEDDSADRITEPGTVGAGGHSQIQHFALDDFGYEEIDG